MTDNPIQRPTIARQLPPRRRLICFPGPMLPGRSLAVGPAKRETATEPAYKPARRSRTKRSRCEKTQLVEAILSALWIYCSLTR